MVNIFRIDRVVRALSAEVSGPASEWKVLTNSERFFEGFHAIVLLLPLLISLFGIYGNLTVIDILARLAWSGYTPWWNLLLCSFSVGVIYGMAGVAVFAGGVSFLFGRFAIIGAMPKNFGRYLFNKM